MVFRNYCSRKKLEVRKSVLTQGYKKHEGPEAGREDRDADDHHHHLEDLRFENVARFWQILATKIMVMQGVWSLMCMYGTSFRGLY